MCFIIRTWYDRDRRLIVIPSMTLSFELDLNGVRLTSMKRLSQRSFCAKGTVWTHTHRTDCSTSTTISGHWHLSRYLLLKYWRNKISSWHFYVQTTCSCVIVQRNAWDCGPEPDRGLGNERQRRLKRPYAGFGRKDNGLSPAERCLPWTRGPLWDLIVACPWKQRAWRPDRYSCGDAVDVPHRLRYGNSFWNPRRRQPTVPVEMVRYIQNLTNSQHDTLLVVYDYVCRRKKESQTQQIIMMFYKLVNISPKLLKLFIF